jgi:large subunit ribosomal protein L7A
MSYEKVLQAKQIKVGLKQTLKAVKKGLVLEVILAHDADQHIISQVENACQVHSIPVRFVPSKKELGAACRIDVEAASVAIEK